MFALADVGHLTIIAVEVIEAFIICSFVKKDKPLTHSVSKTNKVLHTYQVWDFLV